jgi:hypothetical protein
MTACEHLTLLGRKLQVVFLLLSRKEPCGFLKLFDMTSYDFSKKFTSGKGALDFGGVAVDTCRHMATLSVLPALRIHL